MNWLRKIYNVCWGRITWGSSFETEGTFGSIESWKRQERHRKRGLQIACVSFTLYFHDIWQKDSKLFGEWPSSLHWRFLKVDFSLEFPSLLRIRKPILHCESFLRLSPVFWNTRIKEHKILELKSVIVRSSLALWLKIKTWAFEFESCGWCAHYGVTGWQSLCQRETSLGLGSRVEGPRAGKEKTKTERAFGAEGAERCRV